MSRLNEDVVTPPGAMKGSLGKSTAEGMEPTTPQGPIKYSEFEAAIETPPSKSATAGVPGAVPGATRGRAGGEGRTELEEDLSYHQPYPRDISHGEDMIPSVKGREAEQKGDEIEVKPQEQKRSTSSQETTAVHKQGLRASASDIINKASNKAAVARQYAGSAAERTKEGARQAAGVARVQLHRVVVVGKEKAGIPGEKPLLHAAKEKMGIAPDQPVREAARQITRQTVYSARERIYNFTAWFFNFVATLPATIKEMHFHGKRLAEEKDRALAQQGQQGQIPSSMTSNRGDLPTSQQQGQQQRGEEGSQPYQQHGVSLPMPREHVNQSAAETVKETHVEGASGAQGAWQEQEQQFHEGGEGASGGASQDEGQRRGLIGKNVATDESGLYSGGAGGGGVSSVPAKQGTSALQDRVKGDMVIDESGMHSLK
ncbi:hypothetical protein Ndes2526B_g04422 [Nannochloris sp. 'desiccata']